MSRSAEMRLLTVGFGFSYGAAAVYSISSDFSNLWAAVIGFVGFKMAVSLLSAVREKE